MAADNRTLAATLALIGAAHPAPDIEAWRLEGTELDEDAVVALLSDRFSAPSDRHVQAA